MKKLIMRFAAPSFTALAAYAFSGEK